MLDGHLTCKVQMAGTVTNKGVLNGVINTGGGGTKDHTKLANRDKPNQHPMGAITGLEETLGKKLEKIEAMSNMDIDRLFE